MYALELIQQIFRDMRAHKVRTILAFFGIVWGTIAVVLLLALGEGFYQANQKNMMKLVDNAIVIYPGHTSLPYDGQDSGRSVNILADDVVKLKKVMPQVKEISPVIQKSVDISFGNRQLESRVSGVSPDYQQLTKREVAGGGRFINQLDVLKQRRVVFLGDTLAENLFKNLPAVGQTIMVNQIPFTVIGKQQASEQSGEWYRNFAMIPFTTAIDLWGDEKVRQFIVSAQKSVPLQALQEMILKHYARLLQFDSNDKMALRVFDPSEALGFITWFFRSIQIFLGLCGAMTLAVGGIGVANIMYLIISERTREIGLRMALGARSYHILWQIMLEALIIVLCGSIIGFLSSLAIVKTLTLVTLPEWLGVPTINVMIFVWTAAILTLIGLVAGFFPARRAASMKPVTALAF